MASLSTTLTSELEVLKQSLRTQNATHMAALTQHVSQSLSSLTASLAQQLMHELRTLKTAFETQRAEHESFKTAVLQTMSQELTTLRTAFTEQAREYSTARSLMKEQLEGMKLTQQLQHDDLVSVHAALHAVCAQCEALKGTPAAVAKHVQALDLRPLTVASPGGVGADSQGGLKKGPQGGPNAKNSKVSCECCRYWKQSLSSLMLTGLQYILDYYLCRHAL